MNNKTNNKTCNDPAHSQEPRNIPVSILIRNTKVKISEAINTSGLPASVLELVLKEMYTDIKLFSDEIYQNEKTEYEKSLKEPDQNN